MQLTAPIYHWDKDGQVVVHYQGSSRGQALNFTGTGWVESRYGIVKSTLGMHPVILTDTDLLAHADYSDLLGSTIVVLAYNDTTTTVVAASKRRLRNACAALKARGIKVRYFASMATATNFIAGLSNGK